MKSDSKICDDVAKKYKKEESETNAQYYQRIKRDFLNKIFQERHYYRKIEVRFDKNQITINNKKEIVSFYHVTSSQKSKSERRIIDIERYEKCMLIFAVLDNCKPITCTCVTVTTDPTCPDRLRIYCSKYRYVIIIENKAKRYDFITAFPVTKKNEKKFI
jgi:hypothetical protein